MARFTSVGSRLMCPTDRSTCACLHPHLAPLLHILPGHRQLFLELLYGTLQAGWCRASWGNSNSERWGLAVGVQGKSRDMTAAWPSGMHHATDARNIPLLFTLVFSSNAARCSSSASFCRSTLCMGRQRRWQRQAAGGSVAWGAAHCGGLGRCEAPWTLPANPYCCAACRKAVSSAFKGAACDGIRRGVQCAAPLALPLRLTLRDAAQRVSSRQFLSWGAPAVLTGLQLAPNSDGTPGGDSSRLVARATLKGDWCRRLQRAWPRHRGTHTLETRKGTAAARLGCGLDSWAEYGSPGRGRPEG